LRGECGQILVTNGHGWAPFGHTFGHTFSTVQPFLLPPVERVDSPNNSTTTMNAPEASKRTHSRSTGTIQALIVTATLANWSSIENKGSRRPCRSFLVNKFSSKSATSPQPTSYWGRNGVELFHQTQPQDVCPRT